VTHVLWICSTHTIADGVAGALTPADAFAFGVPPFINRVAAAVDPDGIVLLDRCAVEALALDDTSPAELRRFGWTVADQWQPWNILRRPALGGAEHVLHVGLMPRIEAEPERFPLLADTAAQTVRRLVRWRHLAGVTYHGTPGVAGVELLRRRVGSLGRPRLAPRWHAGAGWSKTIPHTCEQDYSPRQWSRGLDDATVAYDLNRAYLAAAGNALVARNDLQHVSRPEWQPRAAGYWLVELSPWQLADRMPDPAGYAPRAGGIRWLTTPTVRLLDELTDAGHYGGYSIHDAWIAPGSRVTAGWASTLNGICQHWHAIPDDPDGPAAIRAAGKAAYRETIGLFDRPGGMIYRPDWRHTIIATARVNLWRALWQLGERDGVWPLAVDVDAAYYPGPVDLPTGGQLGQFKLTRGRNAA
jgi:hypothetical protein